MDDEDFDFYDTHYSPSEIYPYLYLGDATHATERRILDKFNIRFIVNCANDVDSPYMNDPDFRYLNIQVSFFLSAYPVSRFPSSFFPSRSYFHFVMWLKVSDEPSSHIATHFVNAFEFLGELTSMFSSSSSSFHSLPLLLQLTRQSFNLEQIKPKKTMRRRFKPEKRTHQELSFIAWRASADRRPWWSLTAWEVTK